MYEVEAMSSVSKFMSTRWPIVKIVANIQILTWFFKVFVWDGMKNSHTNKGFLDTAHSVFTQAPLLFGSSIPYIYKHVFWNIIHLADFYVIETRAEKNFNI